MAVSISNINKMLFTIQILEVVEKLQFNHSQIKYFEYVT